MISLNASTKVDCFVPSMPCDKNGFKRVWSEANEIHTGRASLALKSWRSARYFYPDVYDTLNAYQESAFRMAHAINYARAKAKPFIAINGDATRLVIEFASIDCSRSFAR